MSVFAHPGSWLIPLGVTLAAFLPVWLWGRSRPRSTGYGAGGDFLALIALYVGAFAASLAAWLIWALAA